MNPNVGSADRQARLALGLLVLLVGVAGIGGLVPIGALGGVLLAVVGSVLVLTGVVQRCLIYRIIGMNTA